MTRLFGCLVACDRLLLQGEKKAGLDAAWPLKEEDGKLQEVCMHILHSLLLEKVMVKASPKLAEKWCDQAVRSKWAAPGATSRLACQDDVSVWPCART